jgi:hypothetical protein
MSRSLFEFHVDSLRFFPLWPPQHYVWAGGHFILLISALRYIFAWAFFKTVSLWWYKGLAVLLPCTAAAWV